MKRYVLIGGVVLTMSTSPLLGADMSLVPAGANMPHTIEGDEITVPAGARVELDVMLSGWGPSQVDSYSAAIRTDGSGFSGGTGGSLSFYRPPCTSDSQCETLVGQNTICWSSDSLCTPDFINTGREDFVYGIGSHTIAPAGGSYDGVFWVFGAFLLTGTTPDDGTSKYGGTFVVDVSSNASGTFTVSLDPAPGWTLMYDGLSPIQPLNLVSARITIGNVGACCDPLGACSEVASASTCPSGSTFLLGDSCTPNPCPAGGVCSPVTDTDQDRVENSVDISPNSYSLTPSFGDPPVLPVTTGYIESHGDQDLCVSDVPGPEVKAQSFGGGSTPAMIRLICTGKPISGNPVASGATIFLNCGNSGTTRAVVGDTEPQLLKNDLVVATVFLPEGNSVTYEPDTLEVTAPASNNTTLIVVTPSGEEQPLAPGGTTTLPGSAIPTVSTWGLAALTLLLLVGAKVYFTRRRAIRA